jgi:hypothetical protein
MEVYGYFAFPSVLFSFTSVPVFPLDEYLSLHHGNALIWVFKLCIDYTCPVVFLADTFGNGV